jgi:phosphatidylglycerol:prolipoprotein diacylglycerol transferase
MRGIIIGIDPVIFHFGGTEIRWYSLAVLTAILAAVFIIARHAPRRGIPSAEIYSLAGWVVISGVIGARLFHVIDHWSYYMSMPHMIIGFQGLAIWGALIGGGLAMVIYGWRRRLPLWRLADAFVVGLLVGQIIGRFGCIINGDAYGGLTNLPWAFIYTHPDASIPTTLYGLPTHPYPVYEQLWNALTLLGVVWMEKHVRKDGLVFLAYVASYSVARFLLTYVRLENTFAGGLQEAQLVAIGAFLLAAAAALYIIRFRKASPIGPLPADAVLPATPQADLPY